MNIRSNRVGHSKAGALEWGKILTENWAGLEHPAYTFFAKLTVKFSQL
jgi:hypothetical protein